MIDATTIQRYPRFHSPRIELRARKVARRAREKRRRSVPEDLRAAHGIMVGAIVGAGAIGWIVFFVRLAAWLLS